MFKIFIKNIRVPKNKCITNNSANSAKRPKTYIINKSKKIQNNENDDYKKYYIEDLI
jgi:hypothetical protein